jgi:OmpA-OmpF porin, OOP family
MKKLAWSCFVAALLAGSSQLSYAQNYGQNRSANVLEGAYVGLGLGATRARFVQDDFVTGVAGVNESADDSDKGYKLTLGFKANRYWALEVARTYFGKFSHTYDAGAGGSVDEIYSVVGWSGSVLGMLPIGDRFSLFARLGQIKSHTTAAAENASGTIATTLATAAVPVSAEKAKWSTVLGVGAQINFPGKLGLRVEYEDYGEAGDQELTGRARMRMASASLMYRF